MNAGYLHWIDDLLEEAQVPRGPEAAPVLDGALRRITGLGDAPDEDVYHALRRRWLRFGPSGRQLLAALLRHEVFSRRDSTARPQEGVGYYVNR